eukprot:5686314-Amphidinium_carterae.1
MDVHYLLDALIKLHRIGPDAELRDLSWVLTRWLDMVNALWWRWFPTLAYSFRPYAWLSLLSKALQTK